MNRMNLKAAIGVLLLVTALAPAAKSQTKRATSESSEPCPDQKTYTGKYRNWVYGFSIIIPAGLKGYWNSARCAPDEKYGCVCTGDHGRFIPLSDTAAMNAFVGWQMESVWTLRDYEDDEVANLK